jgi:nucleoside-diphosphate-sugar epimerase
MQCIVAGTGYTGARVLAALGGGVGLNRQSPPDIGERDFFVRDLDQTSIEPVVMNERSEMIYSIPPALDDADATRLERLLQAIQPALLRTVYLSTTGVYGDQQGSLTDESATLATMNARAQRRLADEQRLLDYGRQRNCEIVILRVPGIYGPGRLGIERIQSGTVFIKEADAYPGNRIHVEDLVRCCIAALQPETPPGIYNVGDGDHRSSITFATNIAELAGLQPPPTVSRATANETFSELRLSFLRESRILDTTKMREVLGVEPHYSNPEDGIRASLMEDGLLKG